MPTKQGYISTKLSVHDGYYCLDGYFMPYVCGGYISSDEWEAPEKTKLGSIDFDLPKHIPFTNFKEFGVAIREGRTYLFGKVSDKYGTTKGILRYCLGTIIIPDCSFYLPEKFIQKIKKLDAQITFYTSTLDEKDALVVGYGNVEEYLPLHDLYYFLLLEYHKALALDDHCTRDKDLYYGKPDFFESNDFLSTNFVLFNSYFLKLKGEVKQVTVSGNSNFDKYYLLYFWPPPFLHIRRCDLPEFYTDHFTGV